MNRLISQFMHNRRKTDFRQTINIKDEESIRGKIYDPTFEPEGGWDKFCGWAASQGKIAHIIQSRAANAMSCEIKSDNEKVQAELTKLLHKTQFYSRLIETFECRDTYGRVFIEPVWETIGTRKTDLVKLKLLFPPTIRVFFDTDADVDELSRHLTGTKYADYAGTLAAGAGDNVIGYVQNYLTGKDVFFKPDELIMIRRSPSPIHPLGLAVPRQNYDLIMNKLGIERDQVTMARRHGDPKHIFVIPADRYEQQKDEIKRDIKYGMRAGLDFFFKGRGRNDTGDPMSVSLLEPKGNPAAVNRAQEHVEDQFNAAMGWADSFTESTSSNRSVGEIQLSFFERGLVPQRRIIEEAIMPLLEEWLKARRYPEGSIIIEWEDLTPQDKLQKAQILAQLFPYLPEEIISKYLGDLGYPVSDADTSGDGDTKTPGEPEESSFGKKRITRRQPLADAEKTLEEEIKAYADEIRAYFNP